MTKTLVSAPIASPVVEWKLPASLNEICIDANHNPQLSRILQSLAAGVSDCHSNRWRGGQMRPQYLVIPKNQWIEMIVPEIAENRKEKEMDKSEAKLGHENPG